MNSKKDKEKEKKEDQKEKQRTKKRKKITNKHTQRNKTKHNKHIMIHLITILTSITNIQIDHFKSDPQWHMLPTYKYIHFKTTLICPRSIAGIPSGLPCYCTPPVRVPVVIGGLAVWRHNNNAATRHSTTNTTMPQQDTAQQTHQITFNYDPYIHYQHTNRSLQNNSQ